MLLNDSISNRKVKNYILSFNFKMVWIRHTRCDWKLLRRELPLLNTTSLVYPRTWKWNLALSFKFSKIITALCFFSREWHTVKWRRVFDSCWIYLFQKNGWENETKGFILKLGNGLWRLTTYSNKNSRIRSELINYFYLVQ